MIMLAFLVSCELEPQVQISPNPVAPQIIAPVNGHEFSFTWDNEADSILIVWTSADYGFTIVPNYSVFIDIAGNNFAKPVKLGTSKTDTLAYSVSKLNAAVKRLKFELGVPGDVEIRVTSNISASVEDLVSATATFRYATYSEPIPIDPETLVTPIYLLGDATDAGWNNASSLAFKYTGKGVFENYAYLQADKFYKFVATQGSWAPQWGTDAEGTITGGNLVYRATETVTDPPALPSPATAGYYKIVVDTLNLTYATSPFNVGIVGTATPNGWDAPDIKMTYDNADFLWKATTDLAVGKMKFRINDEWTWNRGGDVNDLTQDGSDLDIAEAGNYTITLDLFSSKQKCTVNKN